MERDYFSTENLTRLMKLSIDEITKKMPNNNIDQKSVIAILTSNMKTVIGKVDKTQVNQTNYNNILNQVNKIAVVQTVKQVINTGVSTPSKLERDKQVSKMNPVVDVQRPMVMDNRGKKTFGKDMETLLAERNDFDNKMGFKPTPRTVPEQPEVQKDEFTNFENDNSLFADLNSYNMSVTQGIEVSENTLESYEERLRRINKERELEFKPIEGNPSEEKKLQFDDKPKIINSVREQIYSPNYQDDVPRQQEQQYTPLRQQEQQYTQLRQQEQQYTPPQQEQQYTFPPQEDDGVSSFREVKDRLSQYVDVEIRKKELLEITNEIKKYQNQLETQMLELKKREIFLIEQENRLKPRLELQLQRNFIQTIIDSRTFQNENMEHYVFNLTPPLENITCMEFLNISIPEQRYNITHDETLCYNDKAIHIPKGFYTVNTLLSIINLSEEILHLDETTQKLVLSENVGQLSGSLWNKLGFYDTLEAKHLPDLRVDPYVNLYLSNLTSDVIRKINPGNFTPFDINFETPVSLDKLYISFKDANNVSLDFMNLYFLVELRIHTR